MSQADKAVLLAKKGFHVFRLVPNGKKPYKSGWQNEATNDIAKVKKLFSHAMRLNIGISTSKFKDDEALIVVDVDNDKEKNGSGTLLDHEFDGRCFDKTDEQTTAKKGNKHIIYRTSEPLKQGAHKLGKGLDVRSRGGYIVGAGSVISGGNYTYVDQGGVSLVPTWIKEQLTTSQSVVPAKEVKVDVTIDRDAAMVRGQSYLVNDADVAIENSGGDETTYRVAAKLKDMGLNQQDCLALMLDHWNEECSPPWSPTELTMKVKNAFAYGTSAVGQDAPEHVFSDVETKPGHTYEMPPYTIEDVKERINSEYALVTVSGSHHILWETLDHKGKQKLEHLKMSTFHVRLQGETITVANKNLDISQMWMQLGDRGGRRSYDGIIFDPSTDGHAGRFYNIWKGFAFDRIDRKDLSQEAKKSLDDYLDHCLNQVCLGDLELFKWLMGYLAHCIQKPEEKPFTALVIKGRKGTGKNMFIETIGELLGSHFTVVIDERYLVSNFNSIMENSLMVVYDEAIWAGDKKHEGKLKGMITGQTHLIERKHHEPYPIDNLTRIVLMGNADWIVPATEDERRYAVFEMGEGKHQKEAYFKRMKKGLKAGGYRALITWLYDYDISDINVNVAPETQGLLNQKHQTLEPIESWWYESLVEGHLFGLDDGMDWTNTSADSYRSSLKMYYNERNIRSRVPSSTETGNALMKKMAKSALKKKRVRYDKSVISMYQSQGLDVLRQAWDKFIGAGEKWDE